MTGKDIDITDIAEVEKLLREARICRLALNNGDYPYIIPMCFGYMLEGNHLELYFHSAPRGQKLELIKKNNLAGFEMDILTDIVKGENGCSVSAIYDCMTGTGSVEIINGIEKLTGLTKIISKYDEEKQDHKFSEQALNSMVLIKLTADSFNCRRHEVAEEEIDLPG